MTRYEPMNTIRLCDANADASWNDISGGRSILEEGSEKKTPGLLDVLGRFLSGRKKVTEEEIQQLMNAGEEEGIINEEENEMIRAIFTLRDTVVREIMVPRTDMAVCQHRGHRQRGALDHHQLRPFPHSGLGGNTRQYRRPGVRQGSPEILGQDESAVVLKKVMRAPFFIPESKNLEELLHDFKKKRVHIAIVIDEYGGTSGLVTIEDLLEQIVGDIQDEYDLEEEWLVEEPDGTVMVDARLPIEELEEYFGIEVERDKFDTVGGLISHLTGRIPLPEKRWKPVPLRLMVLDADERRIGKVRIARRTAEPRSLKSNGRPRFRSTRSIPLSPVAILFWQSFRARCWRFPFRNPDSPSWPGSRLFPCSWQSAKKRRGMLSDLGFIAALPPTRESCTGSTS